MAYWTGKISSKPRFFDIFHHRRHILLLNRLYQMSPGDAERPIRIDLSPGI